MTRRLLLMLGIVLLALTGGGTAWAFWTAAGTGTGSAATGTLNPPTNVTAVTTPGLGTVQLSWTASAQASGYYVTRVREGAFYGWPWFYIGRNEDPQHAGERSDLQDKVTIPDVLIQAHSASMGLAFYPGGSFPAEYRGDAFAAQHGSWNRSKRTGYKIIRIHLKDGVPTGKYEDFVTGFVVNASEVWGRPVGVAVARDGALLFSEDGNGTIWRVSH